MAMNVNFIMYVTLLNFSSRNKPPLEMLEE